jgi:tetratricopeptide (TPR) repeat protein
MSEKAPQEAPSDTGGRILFDRYEVLEEVSSGGMGTVYRVFDVELNRVCALKVLLGGHSAGSDRILRFKREARSIASLSHPHIIPIYDVGEYQDTHYFTMEFVEGKNLEEIIRSKELSIEERLRIFIQICRAIQYAHDNGIIHRDLKPHNIIVDKELKAQVMDFGLARNVESQTRITLTGMTMGTPPYMPPEQARGLLDELDERSDIYSLGATLYEMLCGRTPFEGASGMEIMLKIIDEEPVPLRKVDRGISVELETICHKAMERDPRKRYPSANALARDVDRFLNGRPIHARPRSRLVRGATKLRKKILEHVVLTLFGFALVAVAFSAFGTYRYREMGTREARRPRPLEIDSWNFNGPGLENFEDDWEVIGRHRMRTTGEQGRLELRPREHGQHVLLVNKQDIFRGYRTGTAVQFEAYIPADESGHGELGIFLFADQERLAPFLEKDQDASAEEACRSCRTTGYHFLLGADRNSHSVILKDGVLVGSSDLLRLQKGRTFFGEFMYRVKVEIEGCELRLWVNDRLLLSYMDEFPLGLEEKPYRWGFTASLPGLVIDNVAVTKKGVARFTDPLELGDDHYFLGSYRSAIERYRLAHSSFTRTRTADRAAYFIALCRYRLWAEKGVGSASDVSVAFDRVIRDTSPGSEYAFRARLFRWERLWSDRLDKPKTDLDWLDSAPKSLRNRVDIFCLNRGLALVEKARAEWRKMVEASPGSDAGGDRLAGIREARFGYLERALAFLARVRSEETSDRLLAALASLLEAGIYIDLAQKHGGRMHREMLEKGRAGFRIVMGDFGRDIPHVSCMAAVSLAKHLRLLNLDDRALEVLWEAYGGTPDGHVVQDILRMEIANTLRKMREFSEAREILRTVVEDAGRLRPDLAALAEVQQGITRAEWAFSGAPENRVRRLAAAREDWSAAARKNRRTPLGPGIKALLEVENFRGLLPAPVQPEFTGTVLGIRGLLERMTAASALGFARPEERPSPLGCCALLFAASPEDRTFRDAAAKLLEKEPNAVLSYWLGVLHQARGDFDRAREYYEGVQTPYRERAWPANLASARLEDMKREVRRR